MVLWYCGEHVANSYIIMSTFLIDSVQSYFEPEYLFITKGFVVACTHVNTAMSVCMPAVSSNVFIKMQQHQSAEMVY